MISIYIPNVKTPLSCVDTCPCYDFELDECMACGKDIPVESYSGTIPDWCPAIIVEPHGRLIDADQFYEDVTESAIMTDDFKEAFAMWLETQEAVIPASDQEADI